MNIFELIIDEEAEVFGIEAISLVEQPAIQSDWIAMKSHDEQDKSRAHGLDVPAGTWMVSMKIENDKLWNEYISTGKVKAFSIEGFFSNRFEAEKMSDHDLILKEVEDLCQELVEKTVK